MFLNNYLNFLKFKKIPLIVNYHQITSENSLSDQIKSSHNISFENFKSQISWLENRFEILPLDTLVKRYQGNKLEPYSAAITFDDGYNETFKLTSNFLKSRGLPASYFVIGCTLNSEAPYFDILCYFKNHKLADNFLSKYYPDSFLSLSKLKKEIKYNSSLDLEYFNRSIFDYNRINNLNNKISDFLKDTYINQHQISSEKNKLIMFGDHSFYHLNMANKTISHKLISLEEFFPNKKINYINIFGLPFGSVNHLNQEIIDTSLKRYSAILLSSGNNLSKYFNYWKNYSSTILIPRFMPLDKPTLV